MKCLLSNFIAVIDYELALHSPSPKSLSLHEPVREASMDPSSSDDSLSNSSSNWVLQTIGIVMHAMRWRTSIKKLYNRFLFRLNVIVCPNNFSAVSNRRLLYSNSHPFVNQQVVASRVDCQVLSQLYECNTEYGQTTVQTMLDQMNFLHNFTLWLHKILRIRVRLMSTTQSPQQNPQ